MGADFVFTAQERFGPRVLFKLPSALSAATLNLKDITFLFM